MHPQLRTPFLSIVFSFRNEGEVIGELVRRVRGTMAQARGRNLIKGHEIIFVNDASSDNSLMVLLDLARGHEDIRILNMSRTFGVAPCVMAGFAHASGDAVVYMDADLQDPPEVILDLLEQYASDPELDVIHTSRLSRQGESLLKLLVTKIGYSILNRYSSVPIPRDAGDFKLLSRRVVDHVLQFKENNPFTRGIIAWVGYKQAFVGYHRQPRFAGTSKFFVLGRKVISNFFNAAVVNFSSVPLQIASYCGLCAIFADVVFIIHTLYQKFFGHALPGWTAIMIVILFIGGVQLFALGMIGLYLNSVHEQTKLRPNYIIGSSYGFKSNPKT